MSLLEKRLEILKYNEQYVLNKIIKHIETKLIDSGSVELKMQYKYVLFEKYRLHVDILKTKLKEPEFSELDIEYNNDSIFIMFKDLDEPKVYCSQEEYDLWNKIN